MLRCLAGLLLLAAGVSAEPPKLRLGWRSPAGAISARPDPQAQQASVTEFFQKYWSSTSYCLLWYSRP